MYLWINVYEPHGKHKSKTYNRHTKAKKKGTRAYYLRIIIKPQWQKQKEEMNREELKNNWKTSNKIAINTYLSIITLFIYLFEYQDTFIGV